MRVAEEDHLERTELPFLLQLEPLIDAALIPWIEHQASVLLGDKHISIACEPEVLAEARPRLGAVRLRLLLGQEAILRRIAQALLGEALEALEESDFFNGASRLGPRRG